MVNRTVPIDENPLLQSCCKNNPFPFPAQFCKIFVPNLQAIDEGPLILTEPFPNAIFENRYERQTRPWVVFKSVVDNNNLFQTFLKAPNFPDGPFEDLKAQLVIYGYCYFWKNCENTNFQYHALMKLKCKWDV